MAMKHLLPRQEEIELFFTPGTSIREAAIMLTIDHANLMPAKQVIFNGPERFYILMEYCPRNLHSVI